MRNIIALAAVALVMGCGGSSGTPTGTSTNRAAALLVVSGDTQVGTVGTELPNPVVVRVVDAKGTPVAGQIVNFRVVSGGGTVFAGAALTNSNGLAQERWTLGAQVGTQTLEARAVDGTTGAAIVFATFTATAQPRTPQVSIRNICSPPTPDVISGACLYPATCDTVLASPAKLDAGTASLPFRMALEVDNTNAGNGQVNNNDAYITAFEMQYSGGPTLANDTVDASFRVPVAGAQTYVVPLIPVRYFTTLSEAVGVGTLSLNVSVRAVGNLASGTTFTTAWFQVPVTVCSGCLQSVCATGTTFAASCPSAAPGATSPGQTANVICMADPGSDTPLPPGLGPVALVTDVSWPADCSAANASGTLYASGNSIPVLGSPSYTERHSRGCYAYPIADVWHALQLTSGVDIAFWPEVDNSDCQARLNVEQGYAVSFLTTEIPHGGIQSHYPFDVTWRQDVTGGSTSAPTEFKVYYGKTAGTVEVPWLRGSMVFSVDPNHPTWTRIELVRQLNTNGHSDDVYQTERWLKSYYDAVGTVLAGNGASIAGHCSY